MNTSLTRAQIQSWLPWLVLFCICAALQLAGGYPVLRLELPPANMARLYTVLTCHLVHLTTRHWLYDSVALLLIAGIFVHHYTWQTWLLTFCVSALSVSLGLLLFHRGLHSYAGLSGLLHGLFTMGCLLLYSQQPRLASVLGVLVLIKLLLEHFHGSLLMPSPGFTVASSAHAYGVIGGVLSWGSMLAWRAKYAA